ncbi:hypothetical protein M9458_056574, partial [Cirrhinus mrigala]
TSGTGLTMKIIELLVRSEDELHLGRPFCGMPFCGMDDAPVLGGGTYPAPFASTSFFGYCVHTTYNIDDSCQIRSFWSSKPRLARRPTRTVDHGVLTNLARSVGNDSGKNNFSFGLLDIRSLSTKGPLVYDLL